MAQPNAAHFNDTLATVGTRVVTGRDLLERVELMPWLGKEEPGDVDSMKIRALRSLVAEQLLALEAAGQGMEDTPTMRAMQTSLEKLLVRDELYRRDVMAKVPATSQREVREGIKRFAWNMKVLILNARTRSQAEKISSALREGASVDSLVRVTMIDGRRLVADTANVAFGLLERNQEDAVYALTPERRVSGPVETPRLGWVVLYLLERQSNPEFTSRSADERIRAVAEKIKRRKEVALGNQYSAKILSSHRAEAQQQAFDLLAATLREIFSNGSSRYYTSAGYRLDAVADSTEAILADHLNDALVNAGGSALTIRDVLEGWKYFDFTLPTLNPDDFRLRLNAAIKEIVAREYLSREGYREHLDRSENVRHDVDTWMNARLAASMMQHISRGLSVSDEEVLQFLLAHPHVGDYYEVNVREVLSDSLTQALAILERVLHGENLGALARTNSVRHGWAEHDGESGFFRVSRLPEIGFPALLDSTGGIDGPVKTKGGYSVFTVLGKRQVRGDSTISFDSLQTLVRRELLTQKKQQLVEGNLASVAKNYGVTFYYDRLKSIDVFPHNMVTRRFIGFGGSMLAVPPLYPAWEWVERAEGVREVLP